MRLFFALLTLAPVGFWSLFTSLYIDYSKKARAADDGTIKEALRKLFEALENSAQYDAQEFARRLQAVHGLFTQK